MCQSGKWEWQSSVKRIHRWKEERKEDAAGVKNL